MKYEKHFEFILSQDEPSVSSVKTKKFNVADLEVKIKTVDSFKKVIWLYN